jgi:hypothetical protein
VALDIADKPGCITKAEMRRLFERMVQDTPALRDTTSCVGICVNGKFAYYADQDTDAMWRGFALGMRLAERLARATMQPEQQT